MGKRPADSAESASEPLKNLQRPESSGPAGEEHDFEDEFEDEFESEDEIFEAGENGRPDSEEEEEDIKDRMQIDKQTFIPGRTKLSAGESLNPDLSTYQMLHNLSSTWPCLSFDILEDPFSPKPHSYPLTLYAVAGTQAEGPRFKENELMVMKMSGLSKIETEDEESSQDSDDEESDPILESKTIPLPSTVNRVRAFHSPQSSSIHPPNTVVAAMLETGGIKIFDITPYLASFNTPGLRPNKAESKPLTTISRHRSEGYALDWAPSTMHPLGKILTGDCKGMIYLTSRAEGGDWSTDSRAFTDHQGSVEEIQWSPTEKNVFSSASSDGTVKIWDLRSKSHKAQLSTKISDTDVNVMNWSRTTTFNLATGDDAGRLAVWDLRKWKPSQSARVGVSSDPLAQSIVLFDFHKSPITSIEWHPSDDSVLLVGSEDNTVSLWDFGVELDDEESQDTQGMQDIPPQLLFVHYMENIKEAHWSSQHPGTVMATGGAGFSVFKTISI